MTLETLRLTRKRLVRQTFLFCLLVCFAPWAFGQQQDAQEFDCGAEYDPSEALRIGAEYRKALRERDYDRLKELKVERQRVDLWQKSYTRNCSDSGSEVGVDDPITGDQGGDGTSQTPPMCAANSAGQSCDDGLFCTSATGLSPGPDQCLDGVCSGKAIGISEGVALGLDYDISALREALAGGGGSAGICSFSGVTWSGGIKQKFVEGCCESKQSMVDGVSFDGSVTVSTGGVQCDVPAFHWGLAQVGVTAGASVGGTVTGSGIKLECEESCGWQVGGQVGIDVNGGIYVAVGSPNVLKVSGTLGGSGNVSLTKSCGPVEINGCVGPPSVNGSVLLGGWYKKSISYTFSDLVKCWN